ncbi:MAG: hypothetical protein GX213_13450 [Clostridiaceae bacterium]|nr:hypothetical protein [Clostridiaceae bacterium]
MRRKILCSVIIAVITTIMLQSGSFANSPVTSEAFYTAYSDAKPITLTYYRSQKDNADDTKFYKELEQI